MATGLFAYLFHRYACWKDESAYGWAIQPSVSMNKRTATILRLSIKVK